MKERLQKLISRSGLMSRRQAEVKIRQGLVSIDGRIAQLGESADPALEEVRVEGAQLQFDSHTLTLILNKPTGYICTMNDPQNRRLASDLLPKELGRLYPVGRLDYNTEGLLLLTNDGELAQHLTHPSHQVTKTYLVKVRGWLDDAGRNKLETGVPLDDGLTAPATVSAVRRSGKNCWFELTLGEGRNRQVRRMCDAIGLSVIRLKRIALGDLHLGELETGKFRVLQATELLRLKKNAGL
ncbi:pseudouridine synthase [Geopsychrobacter electrodiphilus]|uniref:pseudouridine synthase n=1 Tax=Geopsychrobacter electrodiphilus TaxID=225196 RepID=UPI00035D388B|nr:pseudouridine synthase [Geopsychrobacter electrodiphilus]